jgi:hypothetical protein
MPRMHGRWLCIGETSNSPGCEDLHRVQRMHGQGTCRHYLRRPYFAGIVRARQKTANNVATATNVAARQTPAGAESTHRPSISKNRSRQSSRRGAIRNTHAVNRGSIVKHKSGSFIRFTQAGAELLA